MLLKWTEQNDTYNFCREPSPSNNPAGRVVRALSSKYLEAEDPETDKIVQCDEINKYAQQLSV